MSRLRGYYRRMMFPARIRNRIATILLAALGFTASAPAAESEFASPRPVKGLAVQEFAGPQQFTNATAFAVDGKGRVLVAEHDRLPGHALNITNAPGWLTNSIAWESVADRAAFLESQIVSDNQELPKPLRADRNGDGEITVADLEANLQRIRIIESPEQDDTAGRSRLYTEGFNSFLSGAISGMLFRNGALHVACAPDLWLLDDADFDGEIDHSDSLHHGFGVRLPRDERNMTGPLIGLDGRIYWAASDQGSRVETTDFIFSATDTGAIYRSELDGSRLELYATGFRNPCGMAFNEVGDLFVYDSGAPGEYGRLIHVVEAGDYGWRTGWRILPNAGPWTLEQLGGDLSVNTSRHILPPVLKAGSSPSGLVWHDGVGLPAAFANRFFIADAANGGRIQAIQLKPRGASYERADTRDVARNLEARQLQIAPGGELLALGQTQGDKSQRIWAIAAEGGSNGPLAEECRTVLAKGMIRRSNKELAKFLEHPARAVRLAAQLELVERCTRRRYQWKSLELRFGGGRAFTTLSKVARRGPTRIARLHALWGLANVRRLAPKNTLIDLTSLLSDRDPEIRANMARVAGETSMPDTFDAVVKLTQDPENRVRYFATMSLARYRDPKAITPIITMLRENQNNDPLLRHAGAVALASICGPNRLLAAAHDQDASIRLAAALAMRRLRDPGITLFLNDSDAAISREAARAIYDLPLESVRRNLASRITQLRFSNATARRIIAACRLEADTASARGLSEFAASDLVGEEQRVEALSALRHWNSQSPIDPVTGRHQPVSLRRANLAPAEHLAPHLPRLLFTGPTNVRIAAAQAAAALQIQEAGESLEGLASDQGANLALRMACLQGLADMNHRLLPQALSKALKDPAPLLAETAKRIQAQQSGQSE